MRIPRALLGSLLWILASLLGLVGVLLCVTVILLPVGIPMVMLARRLFGQSVALILPRKVSHPVSETKKSLRKKGKAAPDVVPSGVGKKARKTTQKVSGKAGKQAGDVARAATGRKKRRVPRPW
jgi:hypothetical protein